MMDALGLYALDYMDIGMTDGGETRETDARLMMRMNPGTSNDALIKIGRLVRIFVTRLARGKLLEIVVPTSATSLEFSGVISMSNKKKQREGVSKTMKTKKMDCISSVRSYAQLMAVASLVTELIVTRKTMSQRDVYYALKHLFKRQNECNTTILELGLVLGLRRHELNIIPISKGLVTGLFRFRFNSDTSSNGTDDVSGSGHCQSDWFNCASLADSGGSISITTEWTTTNVEDIVVQVHDSVRFIVVIEKEGVFQRLLEDRFISLIPCIMVTGSGFPDIATRALVAKISAKVPSLQVLGVCDYNPYGLALLLTYRLLSKGTILEGQGFQASLRWLGLRHKHVVALPFDDPAKPISRDVLQPMTAKDRAKVAALINSGSLDELDEPELYEEELQKMLRLGKKMELEAIYSLGLDQLTKGIADMILTGDFI